MPMPNINIYLSKLVTYVVEIANLSKDIQIDFNFKNSLKRIKLREREKTDPTIIERMK
jgi:hypothetical protein